MFFALAGRPVHEAETVNEELLSAMTREAPSMGDIVAGPARAIGGAHQPSPRLREDGSLA